MSEQDDGGKNGWMQKGYYVMKTLEDHDGRLGDLEKNQIALRLQMVKWSAMGAGGAVVMFKLLEIAVTNIFKVF